MRSHLLVIVCALIVMGSGTAHAETIELTPYIDNTIYSTAHNLSNGVGEQIFAGNNAVWQPRRALLAFSLNEIPQNSLITSVELSLVLIKSGREVVDELTLHRLTKSWGEALSDAGTGGLGGGEGDGILADPGDATWSHAYYPSDEWIDDGGDFLPGASASAMVGSQPATYTWGSTAQMVADVQGWISDPLTNAGWILIGNESPNRTARVFGSKDHPTAGLRPLLTVEYTPGVATGSKSVSSMKTRFDAP